MENNKKLEILKTIETSNLNVTEISKYHNVPKQEVIDILIENGYFSFKDNPNARLPSAKRLKNAAEMFIKKGSSTITISDIAKEIGLRKTSLKNYLIKFYPQISLSRISYNEHIFNVIDTEEKAYWLGFLYADGYVASKTKDGKNNYTVELQLAYKDIEHLRKFARFIKYNGEIKIKTTLKNGENYKSARISITNKQIWEDLNKLGCVPRKSLILQFPKKEIFKNKSLIRHFIRGYFDGDGSLGIYDNNTIYHNKCVLSILGTEDMLAHIQQYFNIDKLIKTAGSLNHPNKAYKLTYVCKEAFIICFNLYNNATIFLDRKYVKYMEFCRLYEESYKELVSNIGEGWNVTTEITTETKESVAS